MLSAIRIILISELKTPELSVRAFSHITTNSFIKIFKFPFAVVYNIFCVGISQLSAPFDGLNFKTAVKVVVAKSRRPVAFGIVPLVE